MPVKNYTTSVPADRSILEIQQALVKRGADGVIVTYEINGRIASMMFRLLVDGRPMSFELPVEWRRFQQLLRKQKVRRWDDENYVYRVAWRCLRDWVLAQLALLDTQMVELPQVFLPFATMGQAGTVYELVRNQRLALRDGKQ